MAVSDREVDGFVFATTADAAIAKEEIKKIQYIKEKINIEDPESVLSLYKKMIDNRLFVTPVGYGYLRELQILLYRSAAVEDSQIPNIPLYTVFGTRAGEPSKLDAIYVQPKEKKNYHTQYVTAVWVCVALVVLVLSMFYITVQSPNPNILNYEDVLVNKYSAWEQELTEREAAIREQEEKLQIEPIITVK